MTMTRKTTKLTFASFLSPFRQTYGQVYDDMQLLGQGMERLNLFTYARNDEKMRVFGLFGPNCSNWVKCEYAAVSRSVTTVTLYSTLTRDGVVHVLNLTGAETIACMSSECAMRCLDAKSSAPSLKTIVVDQINPEIRACAEQMHVRVVTLNEIRQAALKAKEPLPLNEPTPDQIFTFCFTSGSTNLPKGALIEHGAMVCNIAGTALALQSAPNTLTKGEVYLSFLPLAHQMERLIQSMMYSFCAQIGFSRGDPLLIMEDVALLRPTIFGTVPRLLGRLHDGIRAKANDAGGIKTKLFFHALSVKQQDLTDYGHFTHPVWDPLVFQPLRKRLGFDRLKAVLTGSAPIAPRVLDFLRCALCCPVNEGYGQTELTCSVTLAHPWHAGGLEERPSHVGGPIAGCMVKLKSIPEMQYFVTDRKHGNLDVIGRGEVLVKAAFAMREYFNLPKEKQSKDKDGWVHTGDVGAWLPNGTLTIVDRANNIFKTSIGEYVHPEKIERAICRCPAVAQAFVFGTTLNARLVAIVCLNMEALPKFCEKSRVDANDPIKLRQVVQQSVRAACQEAGLLGFETPAAINLQIKPFAVETGVLTATFKLVRNTAKTYYKNEIVDMYRELGEEVKI